MLYLLFPIIAGLFSIGERGGPKIYFESYHSILYGISYELTHEDKARASLYYERPIFYGFTGKKTKYYYEMEQLLNEAKK